MTTNAGPDQEMWDERYAESDRIWSGNPNVALVRETPDLKPGRALDLGCGEGADAIWLAQQGWQVVATDISRIALGRAADHAASAGVADQIDWQHVDLGTSFPAGTFDLITASFLHSFGDLPREQILRKAAAAVTPGGVLLIVSHSGNAAWDHDHDDLHFPTPPEILANLDLAAGQWEVLRVDEHERTQNGPDGQPTTRTDNTVKVRRLAP